MNVKSANEVFGHRIVDGSEYLWGCWSNARFLEYECEWAHGSVVFSTENQMVYEATITFKDTSRTEAYRWINPECKDAYYAEAERRGCNPDEAWDDVNWIDLELWSDFAEKGSAIFSGKIPDSRVQVPLDLEDDVMLRLCLEAHKKDITLNEYVTQLLQEVIDRGTMLREAAIDSKLNKNDEHSAHYYDTERNR